MERRELLHAVYASPLEDAPRLVYGDWALERGDPHGELIALQFARRSGRPSVDNLRREAELLERHAHVWLGPLASVIPPDPARGESFERGFLAKARIVADNPAITAIADAGEWGTLESLAVVHRGNVVPAQSIPARLVARLRGLRKLSVESDAYATAAWIEVLAPAWPRLPCVDLKSPGLSLRLKRPGDGSFGVRLHARFEGTWFARAQQATEELLSALRTLPPNLLSRVEVADPRRHNKLTRRELRQLHRVLERFPSLARVKLPRS